MRHSWMMVWNRSLYFFVSALQWVIPDSKDTEILCQKDTEFANLCWKDAKSRLDQKGPTDLHKHKKEFYFPKNKSSFPQNEYCTNTDFFNFYFFYIYPHMSTNSTTADSDIESELIFVHQRWRYCRSSRHRLKPSIFFKISTVLIFMPVF